MAGVMSTAGFMSQGADGLTLAMKTVLQDPWKMATREHKNSPLPWNQDLFDSIKSKKKLRIGWFESDGEIENTPGVTRCVATARKLLEEAGHDLIRFEPDYFHMFSKLSYRFINAAGGKNLAEQLKGDVVDPILAVSYKFWTLPLFYKRHIYRHYIQAKSPIFARRLNLGARTSVEVWKALGGIT